jgi:hypothetical protein
MKVDKFWVYNPSVLFKDYWKIIPSKEMSRVEQLNTITRLIMYYLILLMIFSRNVDMIVVCLVLTVLIIILYFAYKNNGENIISDLINQNKNENKEFYLQNKKIKDDDNILNSHNKPSINYIYDEFNNSVINNRINKDDNIELNSGYINFENEYELGKDNSSINLKEFQEKEIENIKNKIPYTKNNEYEKKTCKRPTAENPFMNIVFSDFLDLTNVPQACNVDNDDIQKEMNNLYNSSIFRTVDDIFSRNNSQNMFYTVPNNLDSEGQTNFRNWLFKTNETCKENTANCSYPDRLNGESQRY